MSCNCSGGTVATGILLFHVKHCSSGRRSFASGKRRFHPCFCLPACCNCPVALSELATLMLMIQLCLNLKVLKHAIAAGKTYCKYNLLRKCGLLAHTSAAFLKNCCTEKLLVACGSYFTTTFVYFQCTKKPLPNRSGNGFLSGFLQ